MTHSAVLILFFGQMLVPDEVKPHIGLHTTPFTMHDPTTLTIACAMFVLLL